MYISNGRVPCTYLCLRFGLRPAPTLFTKLVNMPVSVLCKLYIGTLVYLDNFLILGKTLEETTLSRETANLGFVINLKKSVLHPTQRIEFLGVIAVSVEMTVSLPQENVELISERCQDILSMQEVLIKELAKLLGTLSSAALKILPAPLYMRYLQRQQICNLCLKRYYITKVALDTLCKQIHMYGWSMNFK